MRGVAHNAWVRPSTSLPILALLLVLSSVGSASAQTRAAATDPTTTGVVAADPPATAETATAPTGDYRPNKTVSYAARLITRTGLYSRAGADKPKSVLAPWISDTGNSVELLVLDNTVLATGESWLKVRLPSRPNTASAWIRESNVILRKNAMRVEISLRRHLLRVFRSGHVVLRLGVALGAPSTPTPKGHFAVYQKIREVWWSPLGPWALHLTAHSNVLFEFAGGPGRVAIHGARGVLWAAAGTNPSHGCIRVPDPGIRRVAPLVSPGTPVDIVR